MTLYKCGSCSTVKHAHSRPERCEACGTTEGVHNHSGPRLFSPIVIGDIS